MPDPMTPEAVFHALADGVPRVILGDVGHVDQLSELYAEQTHVVHPFAPLERAPLTSRAELRRHFARGPQDTVDFDSFEAVDRVMHHTADPEVVIGEFRYLGSAGGRRFAIPCIFVLRVRDGKIVESRDYVDHVASAKAFGHIHLLTAQLRDAS
jgi:ketosteroid isomerase-like protein